MGSHLKKCYRARSSL